MYCQNCDTFTAYFNEDEYKIKPAPLCCGSWLCNDKVCPFDKKLYRKKEGLEGKHPRVHGLGVHALCVNEWSSFNDFIKEHVLYSESFPEYVIPSIEQLMDDLLKLIFLGCIEIKHENN